MWRGWSRSARRRNRRRAGRRAGHRCGRGARAVPVGLGGVPPVPALRVGGGDSKAAKAEQLGIRILPADRFAALLTAHTAKDADILRRILG
jgi:hypothetical protein